MIDEIMKEITDVLKNFDETDLKEASQFITKNQRIYITGAGRTGLQGKGFGMRLMHIGYQVYIVGETNTPAIKARDVLIALSGSGKTEQIIYVAKKAKKYGASVISVSTTKDSPLSRLADMTIKVPGTSRTNNHVKSIQLLSSLFDQTVHIVLDALALEIAQRDGVTNDFAKRIHSNLE